MGYIYKIVNNINNKCYIGQTIRNPEKRWKEHTNSKCKNTALTIAINKYKKENFIFSVILEINNEKLDEMEVEYIKTYNSLSPNGYNLTCGGQSSKIMSEESRIKMRNNKLGDKNPNFGKARTKETKDKISLMKKGENHHFYGQHLSEEHKLKLSKSHKNDDLPMYLVYLKARPSVYQSEGYCIANHPNGKNKTFTSGRLTLEIKYNNALQYLNELNTYNTNAVQRLDVCG